MEIHRQLIHFVQHEYRVMRLDPAQGLQNPSRHGSDIGPAVAADLGFVACASQRDADEFTLHGAGNGLPQGSLANTRRPDEAQDDTFTLTPDKILGRLGFFIFAFKAQFADGQEFQDALFDIL